MGVKFDAVYEPGSRVLDVHLGDTDEEVKITATHESGNQWRESRTWNFTHKGLRYRVQIQVGERLIHSAQGPKVL
jgi:hypothetical protein